MESSVKTISRPVIDRLPVNQLDEFACRQLDRVRAVSRLVISQSARLIYPAFQFILPRGCLYSLAAFAVRGPQVQIAFRQMMLSAGVHRVVSNRATRKI